MWKGELLWKQRGKGGNDMICMVHCGAQVHVEGLSSSEITHTIRVSLHIKPCHLPLSLCLRLSARPPVRPM